MLQHVPALLGRALGPVRAGQGALLANRPEFRGLPSTIEAESPEFEAGDALHAAHTADGAGRSPALTWTSGTNAGSVVLVVEDADSPSSRPLVHAIAWNLPASGHLPAGALVEDGEVALGLNSYRKAEWLPPDPPTGHGSHRYVFQFFALDRMLSFAEPPGRTTLTEAIEGHVVAVGRLTGTYERPARRSGWLPLAAGAGAIAIGLLLWEQARRKT